MKTLGIIGTAKNTGKTTTLSFLIKNLKNKNTALTGIGYDGEEIDNITNLPKPRLFIEKDIIVATSQKCIENSDIKYEIISETNYSTSLGKILIIKITKPGLLVLAGPNTKTSLKHLITQLNKLKIENLLIDGSLNRMAPMSIVNNIIFTIGAARNPDIKYLVNEAKTIEDIFNLPKLETIESKNLFKTFSLIDEDDYKKVEKNIHNKNILEIESLLSLDLLFNLSKLLKKEVKILLDSPISLLLSYFEKNVSYDFKKLNIFYKNKPNLLAFTINPFYPQFHTNYYTESYIDKNKFLLEMRSMLKSSVYNIKESAGEINLF